MQKYTGQAWKAMPKSRQQVILSRLLKSEGSVLGVARRLGISPMAVTFRMRRLNLRSPLSMGQHVKRTGRARRSITRIIKAPVLQQQPETPKAENNNGARVYIRNINVYQTR